MSISVTNLTKAYGTQKALNNVSFTIDKGEIVGFLGPNGAGKSTMMKILTGYLPQTEGTANVSGFNVNADPIQVKATVGYLPESNPLYTDMFVAEYLGFVAGTYGAPKSRVADLIEMTGLTPEKHKKIGQLSKGFRQRVGLAAALIHDPEVLILDEPTTGLDPNQLVEIRNLIKKVGKEKTVMLSTHIMQEVEQLCDRVIIINHGEIVADKPIAELKDLSGTKIIVIEFDKAVTANQLKKVDGVRNVSALSNTRFEIVTLNSAKTRQSLFQFAVEQHLSIIEISEKAQNLEAIFRQLTH
jgi:ABC-2 type transport system ATP-binding protein